MATDKFAWTHAFTEGYKVMNDLVLLLKKTLECGLVMNDLVLLLKKTLECGLSGPFVNASCCMPVGQFPSLLLAQTKLTLVDRRQWLF